MSAFYAAASGSRGARTMAAERATQGIDCSDECSLVVGEHKKLDMSGIGAIAVRRALQGRFEN